MIDQNRTFLVSVRIFQPSVNETSMYFLLLGLIANPYIYDICSTLYDMHLIVNYVYYIN